MASHLLEIPCQWLQNPQRSDYQPSFTTQEEWTVVKNIIEVMGLSRYWTLWKSKRHTVTFHHSIKTYNDMFDHIDGVMRALAKKKTPRKEDLFFAVKLAGQKLYKCYAKVTPTMGMLLISAHILKLFRKLLFFSKCDK
jgi:hypothetical protein